MAKRSLQASLEGIKLAKQAFASKGWTQADLAREVGIKTRQPIGRFFAGQPVERQVFSELCFLLGLNWQEIADIPKGAITSEESNDWDVDVSVERVRSLRGEKIEHQCGTLRLLDVAHPVNLDDIYVEVKILEPPLTRKWLELSDWLSDSQKLLPERVSALEAVARYHKLIVLGKPGAGKTTFLQYLAQAYQRGELQDSVPIFIRLKDFGEATRNGISLLEYICQELEICGIGAKEVEKLLETGVILILLDGWDEVAQKDRDAVGQEIRTFCQRYYKNKYAIATRTSACNYQLEGFATVEIADFNQEQIAAFANKWFVAVAKNNQQDGLTKASAFIDKLNLPENYLIRELTTTPLLLHLACLAFDTKANFPRQRSKIYREALDILLCRWDAVRGIQREQNISLAGKIKLLSYLALFTFERGNYVFEISKIQPYIADYLRQLPDGNTDEEELEIASIALLKSIEVQHGLIVERSHQIYAFSHQTFQVYLTAKQIANAGFTVGAGLTNQSREPGNSCLNPPRQQPRNIWLNPPIQETAPIHITDKRWNLVFLTLAEILPNADPLLQMMKQQIDALLARDETVQQFLKWVSQKSWSFQENLKLPAVRAFYFSLACVLDGYLAFALNIGKLDLEFPPLPDFPLQLYLNLAQTLDYNLALTPDFNFAIEFDRKLKAINPTIEPALRRLSELELILTCVHNFDLALDRELALELQNSLQKLREKLPQEADNYASFQTWWQENGQAWTEELKALAIAHRYAGHDWHFTHHQKQLLKQYYEANKLLVDCLNSGGEVTDGVRQQIEETLLLVICNCEKALKIIS